jgi:hypothetical protein
VLRSIVLFRGEDALNASGLWETNGTGSGTFELAPIGGADASGLSPSNLTLFNGEVLFEGVNSSGDFGLWTTDGTAVGTVELTGIVGANSAGIAREQTHRRRASQPQSRAELARHRNRRLRFRHSFSEHERPNLDLGHERKPPGRRRRGQRQWRPELEGNRANLTRCSFGACTLIQRQRRARSQRGRFRTA